MAGICPYCGERVTPVADGKPKEHAGIATVWICPVCERILSISEWMG